MARNRASTPKPPATQTALQRQIDVTDREACPDAGAIDQLVYQLYGLAQDEIRLVEEPQQWPK
jgi:hypothetical protein